MNKRKEFLTKLRETIANPETVLIGCKYRNFDGNCCVIGYAALEAGVDPEVLMQFNSVGIVDRPNVFGPLNDKGLTFDELYALQKVNDSAYPDTRKVSVLREIDGLLSQTTDET